MSGRIEAVCTSRKKGTIKKPVESAEVRVGHGIVGDAHAGDWHRQVSLLEVGEIEQALTQEIGRSAGRFAENLAVRDLPREAYTIGTKLKVGSSIVLEISQIGKECHTRCAVYKQTGDCIMPRLGLFARVLEGGPVAVGDSVEVVA